MKVNIKTTNTDVATIKSGECFWYKGLLYMRIKPDNVVCEESGQELVPAVLLTTGTVHWIFPDTQVESVACMIVSANDKCCENTEKGKWEV